MKKNTFFLTNSKFSKKAVVSLTTFSLILVLMIAMFIGTYTFYNFSKDVVYENHREQEVLNSILNFRSEIVELITINNSNLTYYNKYEIETITIIVENQQISGRDISLNKILEVNISSLGVEFCSNASFYPTINTTFYFNGSCVLKI